MMMMKENSIIQKGRRRDNQISDFIQIQIGG
jgi:hypothetical protein